MVKSQLSIVNEDEQELYIGLMSGTSADSIDAALVDFASGLPQLIASHNHPLEKGLKQRIHQLATPGENEIDRLGVLDRELGQAFADAANTLLENARVPAGRVTAIGSHGQTVRHRPPNTAPLAFTLQIADPNTIALQTGITTVADFRRKDIAAGGQGAPLAPAFHEAVFYSREHERAVINIGGMANITHLPRSGKAIGFDTGPGNVLMDAWILQHRHECYDKNGQWAASGTVNEKLLQALLEHPFFSQKGPKSTGREEFNLAWLEAILATRFEVAPDPADVQATLLELTARTIATCVEDLQEDARVEVYICGGGAHNRQLLTRLQNLLAPNPVTTTEQVGLPADWVEAAAFAWLAHQTLSHIPGNLCSVTGATRAVILGGVYFP